MAIRVPSIQEKREELQRHDEAGRSFDGYSDRVIEALFARYESEQDDYEQELRGIRGLKGRI
jgi:hypothetical protein